jgi:hypothetical protein
MAAFSDFPRERQRNVSPARRLFIGAIVLVTAAIGYATGRAVFRPVDRVVQPIAFSHQKHVEELEMECSYCHEFYETGAHSGLPSLSLCLDCHDDPEAESPELRKISELGSSDEEVRCRKLFRLSDHTYYSHQRHVSVGEIPCESCHGDIAASTVPPERPLVRIDMDFCMDCHGRLEVSLDCTRCHR